MATRPPKRRVCVFCKDKTLEIDYKDTALLRKFISDRGKIRPRRVTGSCRQHQRDVALAVRNARELALLPYAVLPSTGHEQRPRARPNNARTDTPGTRGESVAGQGVVKLFNPEKGFGFIAPDGGGPDVYVHYSAIDASTGSTLQENQRVSFEIIQGKKGPQAEHVTLV
jgi:small subunit ribosomal protein S18